MIVRKALCWIWLELYDEDLETMFAQRRYLGALNGCHVDFIERLESKYSELADEIRQHQLERLKTLDGGAW